MWRAGLETSGRAAAATSPLVARRGAHAQAPRVCVDWVLPANTPTHPPTHTRPPAEQHTQLSTGSVLLAHSSHALDVRVDSARASHASSHLCSIVRDYIDPGPGGASVSLYNEHICNLLQSRRTGFHLLVVILVLKELEVNQVCLDTRYGRHIAVTSSPAQQAQAASLSE